MRRNLFQIILKTLLDYRRAIFLWALGLISLTLLYTSLWPSIEASSADLVGYLQHIPEALRSALGNSNFTTASGYINGEIFSITGPLLFMIFAIAFGSGSIAGEEEKGYLDVIFSYPVKRWEFVLAKSLVLLSLVTSLAAILWLALVLGSNWQRMGLSSQNLATAVVDMALLVLVFGFFSLFVGAASGRRGLAIGLSTVVALGSYLLNTLAVMVKELEPFRKFSPFYYYHNDSLLDKGTEPINLLVLLAISLVLIFLATLFFDRRDVNR